MTTLVGVETTQTTENPMVDLARSLWCHAEGLANGLVGVTLCPEGENPASVVEINHRDILP